MFNIKKKLAQKQQQQQQEQDQSQPPSETRTQEQQPSKSAQKQPYMLHLERDFAQLDVPKNLVQVDIPDKSELTHFFVYVTPDTGYWKGGKFKFEFTVPTTYKYDPPKVMCLTPIFHPNIDEEGHICLNVLREAWSPVLSLSTIVFGLLMLFESPNPDDPLNRDAANLIVKDPVAFQRQVRIVMTGRRGYF